MKSLSKFTYYISIIILIISFFVVNRPKKETVLKIKTVSKEYLIKLDSIDKDTIFINLER